MKKIRWMMLVPAVVLAAACGRGGNRADDALRNDLALASQAQPYPAQFNPAEMNPYGQYNPYAQPQPQYPYSQYGYPQRVQTSTRAPARRTSTRSSGTIYRAPQEPIRNTKRDAVIGAAAGAVLGASTSRDKLKGAIIGAAAGGILGGIIGHTVDVKQP
jgi:YmgG-like glycine-zipper protein